MGILRDVKDNSKFETINIYILYVTPQCRKLT